jgi:hypothetical protein
MSDENDILVVCDKCDGTGMVPLSDDKKFICQDCEYGNIMLEHDECEDCGEERKNFVPRDKPCPGCVEKNKQIQLISSELERANDAMRTYCETCHGLCRDCPIAEFRDRPGRKGGGE